MNLDRVGKYRVVGKIGKGAMGEVYKAHDPLLNRYVALKTIAPSLAADPDFKRRFQREAQSAAQLSHPNIITVYDFGEDQGFTYMAMELLEGTDLREAIRSRTLRHFGLKLDVMEQIVEGLAFAHSRGVVHRDLKPGNIHLQPSGHLKILDFGLARLGASDLTKTGTVMGTPHYMSPEQVRGQKADARSDVFSLGAVFYELLCHHRPFDADSVHGVLFQILEQEPEPMRKWDPEVPAAAVALVERALSKDPARRYADAGEMVKALAELRDSIGGDTLAGASGELTLFPGADATVIEPTGTGAAHGSVRGATALTLARSPAPAGASHLPRTVRPDPTMPGARVPGDSRAFLIGGAAAAVLVLAGAGGWLWMRTRSAPTAQPQAEIEQQQLGILTEALVTSQLELARADLANQDYAAAAKGAEGVLKMHAGNVEAQEVLERARQAQRELDAAATDARAAFSRKELDAASEALSRVMALDPGHPVVGELSGELKGSYQLQAVDGRRQMESARAAAEPARAAGHAGFAEGRQLVASAETAFKRQEFILAAQKYQQARIAFERARRESEEARAALAARPQPSARPTALAEPPAPTARQAGAAGPAPLAPTTAPTSTPVPSPTIAAMLTPPPTASAASPYAALTPPPAPAVDTSSEQAVRRVIEDYARAIESQDIALFRSLKPDLSRDDEKVLRESFKAIKSHDVGIAFESVEIDPGGSRATVRVSRQDVINGRPMRVISQTFRLVRNGASWRIQSIGQ